MGIPQVSNIGAFIKPEKGTVPAAVAAGTRNGAAILRKGFGSCVLVGETGAVTGAPSAQNLAVKLQDSADGVTFADYVPPGGVAADAAITTITAANTQARKDIDLSAARDYIRTVETASFTGGTSPTIGASSRLVLGGADSLPTA